MSDKPIASVRRLAADSSGSTDTDQRAAARTDEGPGPSAIIRSSATRGPGLPDGPSPQ
jgi:hypothetical protein